MNHRTSLLGAVCFFALPMVGVAANIDRATITEVVNTVSVVEAGTRKTAPAKVQQLLVAPNILRTGANSRAEMIAPDQTVTRVGQNTIFAFEPNSREIELQKGSILFQSPTGKGGGTIRAPSASAAVLGTTIIVATTRNGGFKVLLLEGKGRVKTSEGVTRQLNAGQMVYALPGGGLSKTFEFRLAQQVGAARLVSGFKKDLPSVGKIQAAIDKQEKEIASGKAKATNLLASDSPNYAIQIDVARETLVKETARPEMDEEEILPPGEVDAIVAQAVLERARIFTPETAGSDAPRSALFFNHFQDPDAPKEFALRPVFFVAKNIIFDTPLVDLSPFASRDLFQFVAVNDIDFEQSVNFGKFGGKELQLIAGGGFRAAPGTVVGVDTGRLVLVGFGAELSSGANVPETKAGVRFKIPLELSDFGALNRGGGLEINGGDVRLLGVELGAAGDISLFAARDLHLDGLPSGATLRAPKSPFDNGAPLTPPQFSTVNSVEGVRILADRNVSISRTTINSRDTRVEGEQRVRMTLVQINDGTRLNPDGTPSDAPTAYVFGRDLVDLRGVNFFAKDVLIQSQTVRLESVHFRSGSHVELESALGQLAPNPNTNRPVVPGMVNFIRNVRYGGGPAEEAVVNGQSQGLRASGPGIFIGPFSGRR